VYVSLILKAILAPTLFFAVCIGLIRAQPYDDSELRVFLTPPDGCPIPCFLGIRPGVTALDGALAALRTHAWVEDVTFSAAEVVHWTWNGQQPTGVVDAREGGFVLLGEDNIVSVIVLRTTIRFGDVWLMYGQPPISSSSFQADGIFYELGIACAGRPPYFWETPSLISVPDLTLYPDSLLPARPGCG
jgi:hypothetical protein